MSTNQPLREAAQEAVAAYNDWSPTREQVPTSRWLNAMAELEAAIADSEPRDQSAHIEHLRTLQAAPLCDICGNRHLPGYGMCASPMQPLAKQEPFDARAQAAFEHWWTTVGIKQIPHGDEPPEHAYIARLAWFAACVTGYQWAAGQAAPATLSEEQVKRIVKLHHSEALDNPCVFLWAAMTADLNALLLDSR